MLPEMLRAILDPQEPDAAPAGGSIWRLRAALPTGMRARVARVLPERVALDLTARLELRGLDWSRTARVRAPGREPGLRAAQPAWTRARRDRRRPKRPTRLMDEIADGVRTFTDLDGQPAVESVERVAERFGTGVHAPTCCPTSSCGGPTVRRRTSRACAPNDSGRCAATVSAAVARAITPRATRGRSSCPGLRAPVTPSRPPRLEDIAATAAALAGVDVSDLTGEPLLAPPG